MLSGGERDKRGKAKRRFPGDFGGRKRMRKVPAHGNASPVSRHDPFEGRKMGSGLNV